MRKKSHTNSFGGARPAIQKGRAAMAVLLVTLTAIVFVPAPSYACCDRRSPVSMQQTPYNKHVMAWRGLGNDTAIWWSLRDPYGGGWSPQQPLPTHRTDAAPAVTHLFDGGAVMAWRGVAPDVGIWWSRLSRASTAWSTPIRLTDRGTNFSPALVTTEFGDVLMAWRGLGNDNIIWTSTLPDDSNYWTPQQPHPGFYTEAAPALARDGAQTAGGDGGTVVMAWRGRWNDKTIWWARLGWGGWTNPQQLTDRQTDLAPALAMEDDGIAMAWKGANGDTRIWWSRLPEAYDPWRRFWTTRQPVPNRHTEAAPALGPALMTSSLTMAWRGSGPDVGIYWSQLPAHSTVWSPQQQLYDRGTNGSPALGYSL